MRKMIYIEEKYNNLIKEKNLNFSKWIREKLDEEFSLDKTMVENKIVEIEEQILYLKNQKNYLINQLKKEED